MRSQRGEQMEKSKKINIRKEEYGAQIFKVIYEHLWFWLNTQVFDQTIEILHRSLKKYKTDIF